MHDRPQLANDGIALVVPCYNEATRLDADAFSAFIERHTTVRILFVDDGSTDRTIDVLRGLADRHLDRVEILRLDRNHGKAEAVRRGMQRVLSTDATFVGYWDADLSTPLDELPQLAAALRVRPELDAVLGSRVLMLGRAIERRAVRHYAGRIFATAASLTLDLPVYDTQCGAKLFRVSPRVASAFADPFVSSWVFDVEIIARLGLRDGRYDSRALLSSIAEYPLHAWRDIAGSKVEWTDFGRALADLMRIRSTYIQR